MCKSFDQTSLSHVTKKSPFERVFPSAGNNSRVRGS